VDPAALLVLIAAERGAAGQPSRLARVRRSFRAACRGLSARCRGRGTNVSENRSSATSRVAQGHLQPNARTDRVPLESAFAAHPDPSARRVGADPSPPGRRKIGAGHSGRDTAIDSCLRVRIFKCSVPWISIAHQVPRWQPPSNRYFEIRPRAGGCSCCSSQPARESRRSGERGAGELQRGAFSHRHGSVPSTSRRRPRFERAAARERNERAFGVDTDGATCSHAREPSPVMAPPAWPEPPAVYLPAGLEWLER
jgi:hypothetical protein